MDDDNEISVEKGIDKKTISYQKGMNNDDKEKP